MKNAPAVKVCGITRLEDALAACRLGADFIGFIFARKSKRYICPEKARAISLACGSRAKKVGVFVEDELAEVLRIAQTANLDLIQYHGEQTADECKATPYPVIKAVEITPETELSAYRKYCCAVDYLLFDIPKQEPQSDNNRLTRDLGSLIHLARAIKATFRSTPAFMAGGLEPSSIEGLMSVEPPFGVDVCRGVEVSPGVKSPALIKSVIESAKGKRT